MSGLCHLFPQHYLLSKFTFGQYINEVYDELYNCIDIMTQVDKRELRKQLETTLQQAAIGKRAAPIQRVAAAPTSEDGQLQRVAILLLVTTATNLMNKRDLLAVFRTYMR